MLAPATAFYATALVVLKLFLVWQVIALRQRHEIGLGDGGNRDLELAIRAHGNYMEYMPLVLILMFIAEMNGVAAVALHGAGMLFIASRLAHALGMTQGRGHWHIGRAGGVVGTWLALVVLCALLVQNALSISYL